MRVWWWMKKDIHASRPKKPGRVNDSMNVHSDRCFFLIWRVVNAKAWTIFLDHRLCNITQCPKSRDPWGHRPIHSVDSVSGGLLRFPWPGMVWCVWFSFAWNNKNSLQSIQQTASKETTNACSQALIRRLWLCWKCYSVPSAISACLFSLSSSIDLARLGSYLAAHIRSLSIYPAEKFAELEATLTLGDFTVLRSNCVNCRRPQVGSLWWYAFSFCWLQCFYCSLVRKHMASLQS